MKPHDTLPAAVSTVSTVSTMSAVSTLQSAPAVPPRVAALAGLAALAAAMGIGRFAFTPLLPLMQQHAGLSVAQGARLASANYAGYLAGALLCLALRQPVRRLARGGLVGVAPLTLAMGLTSEPVAWLVWRALAGVASAMVFVGVSAWTLSVLGAAERTRRGGTIYAGVGLGVALAGLVGLAIGAAGATPADGWLALGGIAAVAAALLWRPLAIGGDAAAGLPVGGQAAGGRPDGAAPARLDPPAAPLGREGWRLVLCYGALGYGYIIPATFLPAAARALVDDPAVFGWTWPLFGAAAALSTVATATLWRNAPPRRVWAASQVVMAVGVLAPAWHMSLATLLVSALCVGGTFMVMTMAGMQEARRIGGAGTPRLIAAMTTAMAAGQWIGPLTLRDAAGLADALRMPSLLAAAVLLLSAFALLGGGRARAEPLADAISPIDRIDTMDPAAPTETLSARMSR